MIPDPTLLDQLYFYTLAHPDPRFIHQHVVDAHAAQNADEHSKPISVAFALIGLYLHLVKGYSGRQVQLAHMQLAKQRKLWPRFDLPHPSPKSGERVGHPLQTDERVGHTLQAGGRVGHPLQTDERVGQALQAGGRVGQPAAGLPVAMRSDVTVADVMAAPAGPERDEAIERWCASVWQAWSASHDEVARLVNEELWERP